jgi:GGDEF domain-containing protein
VNVLGHYGDGTARAAIREVAAWIRSELNGRSVADRLEQEADR